jgi:CRP-like cAMP-binding protein
VSTSAADLLAGSTLFGGLDAGDRAWLIGRSTMRRFRKGQVLFVKGDPAEWLLILAEGRLKVSVYSPNGDELIVDTVTADQAVGELGVFDRRGWISLDGRNVTVKDAAALQALLRT